MIRESFIKPLTGSFERRKWWFIHILRKYTGPDLKRRPVVFPLEKIWEILENISHFIIANSLRISFCSACSYEKRLIELKQKKIMYVF